jgi:hypothetical protein
MMIHTLLADDLLIRCRMLEVMQISRETSTMWDSIWVSKDILMQNNTLCKKKKKKKSETLKAERRTKLKLFCFRLCFMESEKTVDRSERRGSFTYELFNSESHFFLNYGEKTLFWYNNKNNTRVLILNLVVQKKQKNKYMF